MKKRILSIISLALFTLTLSVTAQASTLYTVGSNAAGTSYDFGMVDTVTGQYTSIASGIATGLTASIGNLTWKGGDSFYIGDESGGTAILKTITTSGILSPTGIDTGMNLYGMAYHSAKNTFYAYDFANDDYGSIEPSTGAWTSFGNTTITTASVAKGIDTGRLVIFNDKVYAAIYDTGKGGLFGSFDYSSPLLGQLTIDSPFISMALATDGVTLYGLSGGGGTGPGTLYTIDPLLVTTSTLPLPSIPIVGAPDVFSGAAGTSAVPEPSTYLLLAIALGTVGFARKKMDKG